MQNVPLIAGRPPQAGARGRRADRANAITAASSAIGDQLPSEKDLVERFGVGRPAVREALFILQQQGFVEITSGARARVTAPSAKFLTGQPAGLVKRIAATTRRARSIWSRRGSSSRPASRGRRRKVATDEDIGGSRRALDANVAAMGNTAEFIRTDVAFHYELTVITGQSDLRGDPRYPGRVADRSAHHDDPHARRRLASRCAIIRRSTRRWRRATRCAPSTK